MKLKFSERIIAIENKNGKIIYTGCVERDAAHQSGIRHLTVIIVPFLCDGANQGKWIVHNRRDKQLAKGLNTPEFSYNLFGGHCNPPENKNDLIGKEISEELLLDSAMREMGEEFYLKSESGVALEIFNTKKAVFAKPYFLSRDSLIPLGRADYDDGRDAEYSFYYALPVPSADAENVIAADDYIRADDSKGNIALPISFKSEQELYELYCQNNSNIEICNAVSRLWEPQNNTLLSKIRLITGHFHQPL